MRFTIRNLLWITAGVSVYAAVIGASMRRGVEWEGPADWGRYLTILMWLGSFVVYSLLRSYRYQKEVGIDRESTVAIRYKSSVRSHLGILGLFLIIHAMQWGAQSETISWTVLLCCAVAHFGVESTTTIVFNHRGILTYGRLLAWEDFDITLKTGPLRLVCWHSPNEQRLAPELIPLPDHAEEVVRDLLAARQSEEEQKSQGQEENHGSLG